MRYKCPKNLLTDRGTNFVSQLLKDVCELFGAKQIQTTAYHPQANGATERLIRPWQTPYSTMSKSQKDWDQWIPYVVFA